MAYATGVKPQSGTIERIYAWREQRGAGFIMAAPHCHPYFELYCVEGGACSFFTGENVYELREGDFLLIPPQVFHYTRYPTDCRRCDIFFREGDLAEGVKKVLPQGAEFLGQVRLFRVPEAYRGQVVGIIERMAREEKIADERSAPMLCALLNELFLLCSRECDFLQMPERIHTTDMPIVRAAQFIGENYAEDISTEDIAAAAGYSPNYLCRRFREAAGIGVHEYLVFIRLQHAALELLSTDHSVTEIALRCGFSGGNYFKDAFKRRYGVTPREYRK